MEKEVAVFYGKQHVLGNWLCRYVGIEMGSEQYIYQ